jgi:hypothetical protein
MMQDVHVKFRSRYSKRIRIFSPANLNLRKKLEECYSLSVAWYGIELWTLREVDQKYLESFVMWCWKRMEKISWSDRVKNEEILRKVKEERNILRN